eukprot:CAMPEP_0185369652 /NCGR_PEP_ID=MMETSP1364-20130426/18849_1 /TAXON_ID=38817 /ORGANISM="Gephyrocapsa oceanica, Strain RCC1303" /LENGTH=193 /DNA_ID=CAMNT_0027970413 /DNA_START=26 /DNA_END=604 /DNA_ORIENTATION=-
MSWASIAQKAPPKAAKEEEEAAPAPAPPRANGIATTARPAAASVPVAAQSAAYEPAPNEIKSVVLSKPTTDAVLGIRLAGRERPRVTKLTDGGLAAKSGLIEVNDVFLSVNGTPAEGHEKTTANLRKAVGNLRISLYRVQLPAPSEAAASAGGTEAAGAPSAAADSAAPAPAEPPRPAAWTGGANHATAARAP